ncbi:mitochondrial ribonuclease P protein 1 homolog [Paramacrobiotus metropolitanus]|uniref:mitochondrial ribonuclease P protein 1 homolog n=1 Tax=Paramacrobiotus metropolitanus TaxID=2943436 RepID=UPI0024456D45|nr:mitochondrial ribonuclease P protein 1 homolog [Paramacrobiotus metropolitanus]
MSSSISLRALIRTASTLVASTTSRSLLRSPLPHSPSSLLLSRSAPFCHPHFRSISDGRDDITSIPPSLQQSLNFVKLPGLSEEDERRFQILQFETEVLRQSGYRIPSVITPEHWRKMMSMPTKHQRLKYYSYLFKIEMSELKIKREKQENQKKLRERHEMLTQQREADPNAIQYGLLLNTMFPYIRDADMLQTQNYKLARARCIGQPLVFDLGFDEWMSEREQRNTAVQLRNSYSYNRDARDPFWLQFCNVNFQGPVYKNMLGALGNLESASCLMEFSEKSYLDMFPKEKIVYLTPNAEFVLKEFNDDDIYVIGCLVDLQHPKPLTLAKAKREGVRMAKLPIDIYLRWAMGHKNLTINQVVGMLVDVKRHGDWDKALRTHIPKRKIFQPEDETDEPYHKPRNRVTFLKRRSQIQHAHQLMM